MWKLVICDLKTTVLLSLSASYIMSSLSNYGTALRIQRTCLSSCSLKYVYANSENLKLSMTDAFAKILPKLLTTFLCLFYSFYKNLEI